MNINKQLNKGCNMKKIIMMITLLTVFATSAHAVYRNNDYQGCMAGCYDIPTIRIIR